MKRKWRRLVYLSVFLLTMMMWSKLTLLLGASVNLYLPTLVTAQAPSSSTSSAAVSQSSSPPSLAGVAVAGSYDGKWRPQLHFSAPKGFINDPNGMFLDDKGVYHLYYQYNPTDTIAGNQHWGHATSRDLYNWTNQPIALAPYNSSALIFSGSAVVDVNNTSGFFPNQTNGVIAYYTIAGPTEQSQGLAYSYDDGQSFIQYANNPVLRIPGDSAFRDPKVLWYDDHWVMIISYVTTFTVGIYTSPDGKTWSHASNFSAHGLTGNQWECPNLVEIPMEGSSETMWLMYVSVQPGAPLGGSIGQYFPGSFNGTHFTAVDSVARIADWGKDNYAAQFFYGIPGTQNQISIAWASNWEYTSYTPTGPAEGWQSTMSLPRMNYLRNATRLGYTLVSLPWGIDAVRNSAPVAANPSLGNGSITANLASGSGAFMLDVNITGINTTVLSNTAFVNFTISSSMSNESITGGTALGTDAFQWIDRRNILGWDNIYNTGRFSTSFVITDATDFQVVIDRSLVEMFSQNGERSATLVYYPEELLDTVQVAAGSLNAGAVVSVAVYQLRRTWPMGITYPNGTTAGMMEKRELVGERMWVA